MKGLRQMPFLRVAIPFIFGILFSIYFDKWHSFFFIFLLLSFTTLCFFQFFKNQYKRRWLFGLSMSLFVFSVAYYRTWSINELHDKSHFSHYLSDKKLYFEGQIADMPVIKGKRVKTKIKVHKMGFSPDSLFSVSGNVLTYIEKDSISTKIEYGDQLVFHQKLNVITPPTNPEAFDYKQFLHFQNIHYQIFIKENEYQKIEELNSFSIFKFAYQQRKKFLKHLREHLYDSQSFSVGSALILGYKDEMSEEIRERYKETGAMHVLAVSGLHVGLIYLIISFFFDKVFKIKNRLFRLIRGSFCLFGIWSFALLTGMSPSVLRASTMFTVIIVGYTISRNANIYNSLAVSAFVLLLYDPFLLLSVGFQLSYLAVFGIVYFQPKIALLFHCENKIANFFWQLFCVSLAAQFITLPLSLYYFHQFPTYFWLSGLIVVPAASIILSGGILIFLFEEFIPFVASYLGKALYCFISLVNDSLFFIQKLPLSLIKGIWISAFSAFLVYVSIGFLIHAINSRKGSSLLKSAGILLVCFIALAMQKSQLINNKKIVIYDIYKKTAINFINNNTSYALINNDLSAQNYNYASENFKYSQHVNKSEFIHINETNKEDEVFFIQNNFIQFYDKRLYILNADSQFQKDPLEIDYLIICGNPRLTMTQLLANFKFSKIIFDSSNSRYKVENWVKYCQENSLPYHYTATNGAWILNI